MRFSILILLILSGLPVHAEDSENYSQLIFVKIPESIMPIERGKKFEDPIDSSLKKLGIGEVGGGGTMLSNNKKDIEWVGVDVYVNDIALSLPSVKKILHKHHVWGQSEVALK